MKRPTEAEKTPRTDALFDNLLTRLQWVYQGKVGQDAFLEDVKVVRDGMRVVERETAALRAEVEEAMKREARMLKAAQRQAEDHVGALSAAQAEGARLRVENDKLTARRFPIMDGPSIPWPIIALYEHQAQRNHSQTLERLAERGGLSVAEAIAVLSNMSWRDVPKGVTGDDLLKRVAEISALAASPASGWYPEDGEMVAARIPASDNEVYLLVWRESKQAFEAGVSTYLRSPDVGEIWPLRESVGYPAPSAPDATEPEPQPREG